MSTAGRVAAVVRAAVSRRCHPLSRSALAARNAEAVHLQVRHRPRLLRRHQWRRRGSTDDTITTTIIIISAACLKTHTKATKKLRRRQKEHQPLPPPVENPSALKWRPSSSSSAKLDEASTATGTLGMASRRTLAVRATRVLCLLAWPAA